MAWVQSHQSLSRHPKTLRAAAMLKISRHLLIGHLQELWWWGLDHADAQGDIGKLTPLELAEAAQWSGRRAAQADAFVNALLSCGQEGKPGFLEQSQDGRFRLHDWYDYAGRLNEQREAHKARMRLARASHVPRTNPAREAHVHGLDKIRVREEEKSTDPSPLSPPPEPVSPSSSSEKGESDNYEDNPPAKGKARRFVTGKYGHRVQR